MTAQRSMLFVSPRFLFPLDSGGRIRTTEILRNLKGGDYRITLASPALPEEARRFSADVQSVCDRFVSWAPPAGAWSRVRRLAAGFSSLPVSVRTDWCLAGERVVREEIAAAPDVLVVDFAHGAVLVNPPVAVPSVLFTHNFESEIFARHVEVARGQVMRWVWRQQHRKMLAWERQALNMFDRVIAVSPRDAKMFESELGVTACDDIPTGVNLDYFRFIGPTDSLKVVFTGSMDSPANIDGIEFLLDEIWPRVLASVPGATLAVVGKSPPPRLVERARALGLPFEFTGRVDDIRPHVSGAAAAVIPLRVGGGTRIKAFEAMAMGIPLVSTGLGIEGLGIVAGRHFLQADDAAGFAAQLVRLLGDAALRRTLAAGAHEHVVEHASNAMVARRFAQICDAVVARRRGVGVH